MNTEQQGLCLVIDRGTTGIKAALYNAFGDELAVRGGLCPKIVMPGPGYAEQDMELIWLAAKDVISTLLHSMHDRHQIKAVTVTGQGDGLFAIDEHGIPAGNAILSMDQRVAEAKNTLVSDTVCEKIRSVTGGRCPGTSNAAVFLKWLHIYENERYKRIYRFFSSKDWIRFKLTGVTGTDPTELTSCGLVSLTSRKYIDRTFELLGIPDANEKRPELFESCSIAGFITREASTETGIPEGIPVYTGVQDMCASPYGVNGDKPGILTIVMGTWGFNYISVDHAQNDNVKIISGMFPNAYLGWTTSGLIGPEYTERMGTANEKERTEVRLDIAMRQCQAAKELYSIKDCETIWAVGGLSKDPVICQIIADILDREILIPKYKETTCRGAARCTPLLNTASEKTEIKKAYAPDSKSQQNHQECFAAYALSNPIKDRRI